MKKNIFPFVFAFTTFLLCACFPEPPAVIEEEEAETVEEKPAKRYYKLRLSDTAADDDVIGISVGSRALTSDGAIAFHDFFEAVFVYNTGGGNRVARAAWNIGEVPQLNGVYRPADGVNYNYGGITGTPGTNSGSALLFAGAKDDKTLLGLGRIISVEDGNGNITTGANIRRDTTSVTFEVAPLKAGVSTTSAGSSFRTSNSAGTAFTSMTATIETSIYIHYNYTRNIPLFKLGSSTVSTVYGAYNFEVVNATGAVFPTTFGDYTAGIILKTGARNIEKRNPRYFVTDGQYNYSSMFVQDTKTVADWEPGYGAGATFANPVRFRFTGVPQDGSVFALVFEIFVYNLTNAAAASDGPAAEVWRISPGIGSKWLDLDDGAGGEGGAIFLGSGNVADWMNNRPGT